MSQKMQPPPRKGKVTTLLKNAHNEQLVKLQLKHQHDSDFLDDIRNFTKMRAAIEKDYAQALLKLATSHLSKKAPFVSEGKTEDGESYKTVYGVWKTMLDETEKIAKARLAAAEVYQQQVSESCKSVRLYKLGVAKKFSFRREACDIQATKARNDYVLALLAANAHQSKFYENDLPELVQYIDCDIYDKVKEYILLIARTELLTCAACQSSFSIVQDHANMTTKQFTMDSFFKENPVLSQPILYDFEPCDNDQITKLSIEHNAALCLSKEARRWAACVTKETRVIRDAKKELKKLLAQMGDKPPYALQSDQIGPQAELEARIDELRQIIRRCQTSKKKAEARLEAMREAGVNIEDWRISESDSISVTESPKESFSRSGTVTSRGSPKSYISEQTLEEENVEVNDGAFYDSDTAEPSSAEPSSAPPDAVSEASYMPDLTSAIDVVAAVQEAWDAAAEAEEIDEPEEPVADSQPSEVVVNGEVPVVVPGQRCIALFSYDATNNDELSFVEQEELELIGDGDGDGWVMARNYKGETGYIPQNYVEVVESQSAEPSCRRPLTSFSSVDYTMPAEDKEAGILVEEPVPAAETIGTTTVVAEIERPTDLPTAPAPTSTEHIMCCQALYDYEATCDEELSFFEGQIIRILRKTVYDVDDGWWEGELDGQIGLFPSLVVEELKENGEPLTPMTPMSPPDAPPPPDFSPPEADVQYIVPPAQIILTQPTPEIEHPESGEQKAPEEVSKYTPLVSSPDTPTKIATTTAKETRNEAVSEEIKPEIINPSQCTEDCPTVVVTSVTGGDTPTSDDDMELKEKEEPPKEDGTSENTYRSADEFECTFPDLESEASSQQVPSTSEKEVDFGQKSTAKEPETAFVEAEKMEVNGIETKNFFSDSQNAETTG